MLCVPVCVYVYVHVYVSECVFVGARRTRRQKGSKNLKNLYNTESQRYFLWHIGVQIPFIWWRYLHQIVPRHPGIQGGLIESYFSEERLFVRAKFCFWRNHSNLDIYCSCYVSFWFNQKNSLGKKEQWSFFSSSITMESISSCSPGLRLNLPPLSFS